MGWEGGLGSPSCALCAETSVSVGGAIPRSAMGRTHGHTALASHGRPSPPCVLCPCSDLKLRVRILIDGTLIIFRVKPEDAGKYTCVPSNSLGRRPRPRRTLTVCSVRGARAGAGEGGLPPGKVGRGGAGAREGVSPGGDRPGLVS